MRSAIEPVVRIRSVDSVVARIRSAAVDSIHSAAAAILVVKAVWAQEAVTHLVVATQAEAKGVAPEGLAARAEQVAVGVQEETDSHDY
jgi:predicted CoA-binding protein